MATTDTELQQLVINVGTEAQIEAGIASGTITSDMLSIATDGADITYDWVGTLAEYNEQNVATNHPDWLCFITDDVNNSGEDVYNNVYSKTTADEIFVAKTDNLPQYLPNLLEYKYTDHLLNNVSWLRADTFSWQSGKIYEAAYNHLVEDMTGATQKQAYLKHNAVLTGDATVSNRGILGGFRTTVSYAQITGMRTPTTSLEIVVKFKLPEATGEKSIIEASTQFNGLVIRWMSATNIRTWSSSNGTSWNVSSAKDHTCTVPVNSIHWIKYTWDGSTYTLWISDDGINYTNIGTVASTAPLIFTTGMLGLGGASWESYAFLGGQIYLDESYVKIDGQYVWKGVDTIPYYETADHHKIVTADQESNIEYLYNKGDSWYYILDTLNERFKLPRIKRRKLIESGVERGVWYRLYDDGWVEQGGDYKTFTTAWTSTYISLAVEMASNDYYASPVTGNTDHTDAPSIFEKRPTYFRCVPYNANYEGRWYVCGQSAVKPRTRGGEDYLYFYVGEFTQDAILNTAGITAEELNAKADADAVVAKGHEVIAFQAPTSSNSYTWYRKYADGWVEQGGKCSISQDTKTTVTMPIKMTDTNYAVMITPVASIRTGGDGNFTVTRDSQTQFGWCNGDDFSGTGLWEVKGMAAA